jgi:hypothetical protein
MNPVLGLAAFKPDLRRCLGELVLQVAEEPAVPLPDLSITLLLYQRPVLRFRIRIRRIHISLGLPDSDPLIRDMDPYPDPSIIEQK